MMKDTPTLSELNAVSDLASELKGSEIIKLAGEIREKVALGAQILNYTVGDFDPKIFPIPEMLKEYIIDAYQEGETNYPTSNGMESLRDELSVYIEKHLGIAYTSDEYLVAAGGRPLIYAAYQALLNPGESALFSVPSWNNNHYTTLSRGKQIAIPTKAENKFMPTAEELAPHLSEAGIIALCSPLNPTGTIFTKEELEAICALIVEENKRREGIRKPLYLLYDQIYWQLTINGKTHYHPVGVNPEMRPYTIYIDGISKAFAATGVRVGWAFGPRLVMDKMKAILGHIGAWSPKPEQLGTARFLASSDGPEKYMEGIRHEIDLRLDGFYKLLIGFKNQGLPVDVVAPEAAIYLTVKFDLVGKTTADGTPIGTVADTTRFLIDEAGLALVPFTAFGAKADNPWYRLSVGTSKLEDIAKMGEKLEAALKQLQ